MNIHEYEFHVKFKFFLELKKSTCCIVYKKDYHLIVFYINLKILYEFERGAVDVLNVNHSKHSSKIIKRIKMMNTIEIAKSPKVIE